MTKEIKDYGMIGKDHGWLEGDVADILLSLKYEWENQIYLRDINLQIMTRKL